MYVVVEMYNIFDNIAKNLNKNYRISFNLLQNVQISFIIQ